MQGWQVDVARYIRGGSVCELDVPAMNISATHSELPVPHEWENVTSLVYKALVFRINVSPHLDMKKLTVVHLHGVVIDDTLVNEINGIPLLKDLSLCHCYDSDGAVVNLRSSTVSSLTVGGFIHGTLDVSADAFPSLRKLFIYEAGRSITEDETYLTTYPEFQLSNVDSLVLDIFSLYVRDVDLPRLPRSIWPIQATVLNIGVALSAFDKLSIGLDHVWDAKSRARIDIECEIAKRIVSPKMRLYNPANLPDIHDFCRKAVSVVKGGTLVLDGLLPVFIGLASIPGVNYNCVPVPSIAFTCDVLFATLGDMVPVDRAVPIVEKNPDKSAMLRDWVPFVLMSGDETHYSITKK